jgi:hypothetical protein
MARVKVYAGADLFAVGEVILTGLGPGTVVARRNRGDILEYMVELARPDPPRLSVVRRATRWLARVILGRRR